MMKEILRTEAIPFTITQISCYISAGAEVMGKTGLPGVVKYLKHNWYHNRFEKKDVICGVQYDCIR